MSGYTGSKAFQGVGAQFSIGPIASSAPPPTGLTGTASSGSTALTLSAAPPNSILGMTVAGTGIPAGTTIVSGSGTSYVLSANTTSALTAAALTFSITMTPVFELTNQPFKPGEWDKLDVSNFNSLNKRKEYIKGMVDSGTVPIEGNSVWNDPGQLALEAAFNDAYNAYQCQVQLPKQQGQTTSGDSFTFNALVMSYTTLGDFDPKKVVSIKGELQITGPITHTAGS